MKPSLFDICQQTPLACDGAMGTQLIHQGMKPGECGMAWNESHPDAILAVHRAYRSAGCRLITTNSFGGTRSMLERHGYGDHVADWNRRAAGLAAEAAGPDAWVLGDVGPFGDFLEPMGDTSVEGLEAIFREQVAALVEGGADAILVETMSDPGELATGVRAARAVCDLPVIATYAFHKQAGVFRTFMGTTVAAAIAAAYEAGASIAGANCGTDLSLDDYFNLGVEIAAAAAGQPTIMQPNAGAPRQVDGGIRYDATPAEMAALAARLRSEGINIIGGCCGTTPDHLAAIAASG